MILDLDNRTLLDGDRVAKFTLQQCRMVEVLAHAAGRVVMYSDLISAVWPDGDEPECTARIITVQFTRARAAIKGAGMEPVIHTVWGRGLTIRCKIEIRSRRRHVVLSEEVADSVKRLLESHPDRRAADVVLFAFVAT